MTDATGQTSRKEEKVDSLLTGLILSPLEIIGRVILKVMRFKRRDQPVEPARGTKTRPAIPTGPYVTTRKRAGGDLLLFVPRGWNSLFIDDVTGRYGYSHVAIDCGEIDVPTGKPVMVESTVGQVVSRRFIDEYGSRFFARIPLSQTGIDTAKFCEGVKSKLGQPYDDLEALTWGLVDDPARQVCSDLATVALPEEMRQDIAAQVKSKRLGRSAVTVHHNHEFISPNGFAQYFGAPHGGELKKPDQLVQPKRMGKEPFVSQPLISSDDLKRFGLGLAVFFALLALIYLWLRGSPGTAPGRQGAQTG
jgi:hypothetical protein